MNSPTPLIPLGIVEGFYGVFYTFPERLDLIHFAGSLGYQVYLYAPKNDRQQRARWWEPYPDRIMDQFAETIQAAKQAGVEFQYGISPGETIRYSAPEDFDRLTTKLQAFYAMGVRGFNLMLDDNEPGFRHPEDAQAYPGLPQAQAALGNRLLAWLKALDPSCTLSLVPAEYSGRAPFSASLAGLAAALDPAIDLYYTGPEICSPVIEAADAQAFARATGRAPLIWDNYPVNDLDMNPELHIAAITGRPADLITQVKGILVNPMIQAEASKIPLATYAAWAADPVHYDPQQAWEQAAKQVAGAEFSAPLWVLAENACISCLGCAGEKLARLAGLALAALQTGAASQAAPIRDLEEYLTEIDEAGYVLKFRMENLALRNNLLPWIEIMEHWMWMTRFAIKALRAMEDGLPYLPALNRAREYRAIIRSHPKRIAAAPLLPILEAVELRAGSAVSTEAVTTGPNCLPDLETNQVPASF